MRVYEIFFKNHINPRIGSIPIGALRPIQIQATIDALTEAGMAPASVSMGRTVIKAALAQAVAWELLVRNPAATISPPKIEKRSLVLPTLEQLSLIHGEAEKIGAGILVFLAINTGMRRGELLALTWADVDFAKGSLTIRRSKTEAGERLVSIGPATLEVLRQHRLAQLKNRVESFEWHENNLVFSNRDGSSLKDYQVARLWNRIRKTLGLRTLRFHDLRHIHVSLLIEAGVDFKVISERVGHSSIKMTLDVYGHLRPKADAEAALIVERVLAKA
jgi:integrase